MPIDQEIKQELERITFEYGEKIKDLIIRLDEKDKTIDDLKNLLKDHRHQGGETVALETLIKNAQYVDGKLFKADGTAGADGSFNTGDANKTITVSKGIITNIT